MRVMNRRRARALSQWALLAIVASAALIDAQQSIPADSARAAARHASQPARVRAAQRFLAQHGISSAHVAARPRSNAAAQIHMQAVANSTPQTQFSGSGAWLPLGPGAVNSQNFGLTTGRISALALDPFDPTGNTLYVGTTGGGVWKSTTAIDSSFNVKLTPLTDNVFAGNAVPLCTANGSTPGTATDASISIGALSVQPGGTGVILAGTGDPNDALDSYYGAGILRSGDRGATWCLIPTAGDLGMYSFAGEGFAGFAWGTVNQQPVVVAAVSQAFESTLVDAISPGGNSGGSYEGLYYSSDSGVTWQLATITDGASGDVQGPNDQFATPNGNAATSVVWNPVRKLFIAAVRHHGYYQSSDGVTFTRMVDQPGSKLAASANFCPTNSYSTGSEGCPIFRGVLAVDPANGDTFAWSVDDFNQDQGIWQDACTASANQCASPTLWASPYVQQWNTAALQTNTLGPATISDGDYTLSLAAIPTDPSGQETVLLAGADDLWEIGCPTTQGCVWRNTTNSTVGFCAHVGEYQHALAWNEADLAAITSSTPPALFIGNDNGLWRSLDGIDESGSVCNNTDATHFNNLNGTFQNADGTLASLAEVASISQVGATPYVMMAGLGVNGTAGVNGSSFPAADWPEIIPGEGGPVAIDSAAPTNWYVNNGVGVSIQLGTPPTDNTPGAFTAVLNETTAPTADVVKDGLTMPSPAPFLVDPLDHTQLLIGTCRVWRGPASAVGWTDANAISSMLDGVGNGNCSGNALIRSMAALALPVSANLPSGGEVVFVGMYGATDLADGITTKLGHVLTATYNTATTSWSSWTDVTAVNPVIGDTSAMNAYGYDISSIFIDPRGPNGYTVYVTVAGIALSNEDVQTVYSSTDGGLTWTDLNSNLPASPANSVVVDPNDPNTVYVATDDGVYATTQIGNCFNSSCWAPLGSGLPIAPVVALSAPQSTATLPNLVAATYGRGIWMTPLLTANETLTTATALPNPLAFGSVAGGSSATLSVTLTNTGSAPLLPTGSQISAGTSDFGRSDSGVGACADQTIQPTYSCAIEVTFTPTETGTRNGLLTIYANVLGGQLTVALSGTGTTSGAVTLSPGPYNFGSIEVGTTSTPPVSVTANNSGSTAVPFTAVVTRPFALAPNSCTTIPAYGSCALLVTFTPIVSGSASGSLSLIGIAGTPSVTLSGTGLAAPTDTLSTTPSSSPLSLNFADTIDGQISAAKTVTLTNSGGMTLNSIAISVTGPFQISNRCAQTLAPESSCTISVQFAPGSTDVGSKIGTLSVGDVTRSQPQTVALSGVGIAAPAFGANPSSLTFSSQIVSQASQSQTVTISNVGGAPLTISGFQITGPSASSFSCGTTICSATTCGSTLSNINGQNSCTVQVIFTPSSAGGSQAYLQLSSSNAVPNTISVSLFGTGQNPAGLNVSPAQIAFSDVFPGQSTDAVPVTITNTGGSTALSLTVTATPPFTSTTTCGTSLAAGANCTASVVFSPQLTQTYSGTLTVASPSLTSAIVQLSGTGETPGTVLTQPPYINFSQETGVGLTSAPVTLTLSNPSGGPRLTDFGVTAPANFQLATNNCPATLLPGTSCQVGVEFAPSATSSGSQSGNLTIKSSAMPTVTTVPLTGMGFDFTVCFGLGNPCVTTASQTVSSGQTANYTLMITPLNGSSGAFTVTCGTLPTASKCTPDPNGESVPPGSTGNETVEIATGSSTSSAHLARPTLWPALPLALGLLFAPFALRRRRSFLLILLLALLMGGISSCTSSGIVGGSGGNSGGGGGGGGSSTPAGTYSIPVTVTSNNISHTVNLTLIVD